MVISFGLRNVADVPAALREMARVVRPGGRLVICEFSRPTWRPFRALYLNYLMRALPWVARRVSSNADAYVYLAESIRAWPAQDELAAHRRRGRVGRRALPQPDRRDRGAAHGRPAALAGHDAAGRSPQRRAVGRDRGHEIGGPYGRRATSRQAMVARTAAPATVVPTARRSPAPRARRTAARPVTAGPTAAATAGPTAAATAAPMAVPATAAPMAVPATVAPTAVPATVVLTAAREQSPPRPDDGRGMSAGRHDTLTRSAQAMRRSRAASPAPPIISPTEHWGRAPLLTRAAELGRDFTDLLDAAAVDELVSTPRRCARRSCAWPRTAPSCPGPASPAAAGPAPASPTRPPTTRCWPRSPTAPRWCCRPCTAPGRRWSTSARRLRTELGHPVQINAYITPPQNQGFAPHYDVHDVFVLQVAGRKQWTIHAPVVTDPLDNQPWDKRKAEVAARAAERAADRHRPRTRRRAVPAPRHDPRREGAGRDVDPPDRRACTR